MNEIYIKTNALYITALFIVSLGVVAVAWFIMHALFVTLQPVCSAVAQHVGSNSSLYNQADSFFINIDNWLGVIALIALVIGAWQYSQRKGHPVYG